jgi:HK97 family phage major capsid protein
MTEVTHVPTLTELREQHTDPAQLEEACRAAVDLHNAALRRLDTEIGSAGPTASQQRRWDAHASAVADLQEYVGEQRMARVVDSRQGWSSTRVPAGGGDGAPPLSGNRDRARRALDGLKSVPDDGRERLVRAFDRTEAVPDGGAELDLLSRWLVAASAPAYARAVGKLFRDPINGHREFTNDELRAYQDAKVVQRAMSIGTDSAGGFMLPTHLDPTIMLSNAGAIDPIRQLARNETIVTDTWNGISSAGVTASWDAEATEVSDDSPTLAQPSVPTHKGAAFIAASIEAAMDTNIGNQVSALFVDAKLRLEATAFLDGTGSGQPTGVITALAAGQKVATATADVLVSADVTKPAVALPPRWQPNAAYIANNATAIAVGAFETTGGSLRYPEINGTPATLLRKPFHEHSGMETAGTTATAGNDSVLLLGAFDQYLVVDRVGTTVEYIPHLFGTTNNRPTGQRGWYMYWRTGGDALIDDAFRLLTA